MAGRRASVDGSVLTSVASSQVRLSLHNRRSSQSWLPLHRAVSARVLPIIATGRHCSLRLSGVVSRHGRATDQGRRASADPARRTRLVSEITDVPAVAIDNQSRGGHHAWRFAAYYPHRVKAIAVCVIFIAEASI